MQSQHFKLQTIVVFLLILVVSLVPVVKYVFFGAHVASLLLSALLATLGILALTQYFIGISGSYLLATPEPYKSKEEFLAGGEYVKDYFGSMKRTATYSLALLAYIIGITVASTLLGLSSWFLLLVPAEVVIYSLIFKLSFPTLSNVLGKLVNVKGYQEKVKQLINEIEENEK